MADVTFDRYEVEEGDLPPVCMRCGRRDVQFNQRYFRHRPFVYPPLLALAFSKGVSVAIPLCSSHGGWRLFAHDNRQWWGLRPISITPETVTIRGVCEEFLDALEEHRARRWDRDEGGMMEAVPVGAPRRRRPPPRMAPPPPSSGSGVVWIVLAVIAALPLLGCAGLGLLLALAPRPVGPPAFPPLPPPATAVGPNVRPEFVGALAVDPNAGAPGGLPWAALVMTLPKDGPGAPTDADLDKALAELKDPNGFTASAAASRLAASPPVERRRAEVGAALTPLLQNRSPFVVRAGAEALVVWGGPDDVPALVAALQNPFPDARQAAIKALAAIKDERGAAAVAGRLTDFVDRDEAAKALETMGPAAEKAVRPYLTDRDREASVAACRVLKAVGSKESLDALQAASRDRDPGVAAAAAEALQVVKGREEEKRP